MSPMPPASSDPTRPPRPAPVVPDYQMDRLIGRGSYGEVWLAHSTLGTRRAVKVVYRDSFDSERPYLREFAGIRAYEPVSSHESQVSVFHVGKNDEAGYFYYVMELADDAASLAKTPSTPAAPTPPAYAPATLAVWLKQRGRLPSADALSLARALATALDHLHGHGLVHRDIKPANIILVGGRPKLADIGLVTSATCADTLVGTTGFIPPEGPGTAAADLYSLGKVLYEVVTGRDRQEFPNLPDDLQELPDRALLLELNEVILKCCHQDPRERYAAAADLLADVKRIEAGRSLRRERARRRRLLVAACLAPALLAGFGVVHFSRPSHPPKPDGLGLAPMPPAGGPRWTNSLGMIFVPIPGLPVEFSIWETRVQDFRAFVDATGHQPDVAFYFERGNKRKQERHWSDPAVAEDPTFPVRAVSGADARAFCEWLTAQERKAGQLAVTQQYRLPRDAEWSWAAGLTNETGATAVERHLSASNHTAFYWGTNWPPPAGFGNFAGEESPFAQSARLRDYLDDFSTAAPVGSFPVERNGLFDLAGNVGELCEEWPVIPGATVQFVRRGAAWDSYQRATFEVRHRRFAGLRQATIYCGFRIVRAPVDEDRPPPN